MPKVGDNDVRFGDNQSEIGDNISQALEWTTSDPFYLPRKWMNGDEFMLSGDNHFPASAKGCPINGRIRSTHQKGDVGWEKQR